MVLTVVLLACAGIALIMSEVFLPGGIVGTIGAAALIACIVLAFLHFSTAGIVATVVLIPAAGIAAWHVAFKVLRRTPLGRSVFLSSTQKGVSILSDTAAQYECLIGRRGVAKSYLRPVGIADIDDKRIDVVTEGDYIEAGTPIEVIALDGNHLVVRAIDETDETPKGREF